MTGSLPQPFCTALLVVSLENSSSVWKGDRAAEASSFQRAQTAIAPLSGRWFGRGRRDGSEKRPGRMVSWALNWKPDAL